MTKQLFCIQMSDNLTREKKSIINASESMGVDYVFGYVCPENAIPIGSIEFCEGSFGKQPLCKEFYPKFLSRFISRNIEVVNGPYKCRRPAFVKCAARWKSTISAGIYETGQTIPKGSFYVSDVVKFTNEWRYYVADGEVVTSGWYDGEDEDCPAPELNINWPNHFSGAVDFGTLDDGRLELVEAHAPFACGWYGDDHSLYLLWQMIAWQHRDYWLSQLTLT